MYSEYYGLTDKPFAIEPDSRFLVLVEHHREALATMVYAIEEREGWALVLGEPGLGKTTLITALIKELGENVVAGVVTNPSSEPLDFFNQAALELGLDGPFAGKSSFLDALSQLIFQCKLSGKQILLIVDEAQHLSAGMLEEIRLLGNQDKDSPRVLNIFLVGQPELIATMKQGGARALMQRLHRNYALKRLSPAETAEYVHQRLALAGCPREIFSAEALAAVHQVTGGIPRLINSVCDGALILGFAQDRAQVGPDLIRAVAREDASLIWPPSEALASPPSTPVPAPEAESAPPPVMAAIPEVASVPVTAVEPPSAAAPRPLQQQDAPKVAQPVSPPVAEPAPAPLTSASGLADLLDSLEAPPQATVLEVPPAPELPKPPPGLSPPRRPLPAATARPEGKKERIHAPKASVPGGSSQTKGGLLKRLIILLLVLGLAVGGYFGVKRYWYRIGPMFRSAAPDVVIPDAPTARRDGRSAQGPLDWGPSLHIPPQSTQGQGDNRG